jgi:hypothetical protein
MSTYVQDSPIASELRDVRDIPIAEVADGSYDLAGMVRRAILLSSSLELPSVSAFNSSI